MMTTMELPFDFFIKPKSAAFLLNWKSNANIFFFLVAYFNGLFQSWCVCWTERGRGVYHFRYSLFFIFNQMSTLYDEIALLWLDWRVPYEAWKLGRTDNTT